MDAVESRMKILDQLGGCKEGQGIAKTVNDAIAGDDHECLGGFATFAFASEPLL